MSLSKLFTGLNKLLVKKPDSVFSPKFLLLDFSSDFISFRFRQQTADPLISVSLSEKKKFGFE